MHEIDEPILVGGSRRRRYTMRVRAERLAETRQRIVAAAIELGMAKGPLNVTLSAIAERAGVERATVYRHFPDQRSILRAAAIGLAEQYPPPDPDRWPPVSDPRIWTQRGLEAVYAHYREFAPMAKVTLRDAAIAPEIVPLEVRDAYLQRIERAVLKTVGRGRSPARLRHAVRHALDFGTWLSLTERQGMTDRAAASLMANLVLATAGKASTSLAT